MTSLLLGPWFGDSLCVKLFLSGEWPFFLGLGHPFDQSLCTPAGNVGRFLGVGA